MFSQFVVLGFISMRRIVEVALCAALVFVPVIAIAAEASSFAAGGTGTAVARPDIAFVDIGFKSRGLTPQEAVEIDTATVGKVTMALEGAGVVARDLQTANYLIEQVMGPQGCGQSYGDRPFVPCEVEGFEIRNSITIRIRDLANYGKVLGAAIEAGLSDISRITLAVSDPEPYRRQAYASALLAAREKAELTAETLGFKLGAILDIGANFQSPFDRDPPATLRDGQDDSLYERGEADLMLSPIQAGELTFSEDASITYQIVQEH